MARSLNKVQLIGNLTRDPELRYTPSGAAVCTIGLATNRQWQTEAGEKKEDAEFHKLVAWNKLAEICSQLLKKGRKIYVEGRLQTRAWQGQDGSQKQTTEIVINDMIILDSKGAGAPTGGDEFDVPESVGEVPHVDENQEVVVKAVKPTKEEKKGKKEDSKEKKETTENDEEIPF